MLTRFKALRRFIDACRQFSMSSQGSRHVIATRVSEKEHGLASEVLTDDPTKTAAWGQILTTPRGSDAKLSFSLKKQPWQHKLLIGAFALAHSVRDMFWPPSIAVLFDFRRSADATTPPKKGRKNK